MGCRETATWGHAAVGRVQAWEESRQLSADLRREAKRKARTPVQVDPTRTTQSSHHSGAAALAG
jgi:hypothetical protein